MVEGPRRVTWEVFDQWCTELSTEDRRRGDDGQWSEGTPPLFIDLLRRTTPEERLIGAVFGEEMPIEEILSRPEDYGVLQAEEARKRMEARGGTLLRERVKEVVMSLSEIEGRVFKLRFGLDDGIARTQAQVGTEFDPPLSRWKVGRIGRGAWTKLRAPSSHRLKDYLVEEP